MFHSKRKPHFTLGLYQAASGLIGALVRHEAGEPTLLGVFGGGELSGRFDQTPKMSVSAPLASAFGGDGYGGDGASSTADIFLTSEFGPIPVIDAARPLDAQTTAKDLLAMLARCGTADEGALEVVWCLGTSHFSWTELRTKESDGLKKQNRRRPPQALPSVLIPMPINPDALSRFLSFTPRPDDPASAMISEMRRTKNEYSVHCTADSEVSALLALSLTALRKAESAGEATLVARVGEDDVLVLVLRGQTLEQVEILRSLSIHDGPDMICSRILLLQDEFGVGDVDRVFVTASGDDSRFVDSFQTYFRQATVSSLGRELEWLAPGSFVESEALPAIGAALRDVLGLTMNDNMLPDSLRRPPRSIPYSWEVWSLLLLLALTAVFFAARYLDQRSEISSRHNRIEAMTHDANNAERLRGRIDSLQIAYSVNTNGLDVLDSLLVGSDRWSRMFDQVSGVMREVGDVWIDKWQPAGSIVDLTGRGGSRDRIVELARHLDGTVEEISYPNAQNDLYSFRMKVPVTEALPEAAIYLRERAVEALADGHSPIIRTER